MEPYLEYCDEPCKFAHTHVFKNKSVGSCLCRCNCHDEEGISEWWPGPCAACCNAGDNCDCGRYLNQFEKHGKKMVGVALHNLKFNIEKLPQPTLGLAGGVNRKQVIALIEEMMKNYDT